MTWVDAADQMTGRVAFRNVTFCLSIDAPTSKDNAEWKRALNHSIISFDPPLRSTEEASRQRWPRTESCCSCMLLP